MYVTIWALLPEIKPMMMTMMKNEHKKHLKNVGPIRHCEPFYIAIHQVSLLSHATTVARRLRIDVYNDDDDNNDNA